MFKTFILSTNIDTLVPSLYQCVETRSIEVFEYCLRHFCTWSGIIFDFRTSFREFLHPAANRFTRKTLPILKSKKFLYEYHLQWVLFPTETRNRMLLFGRTILRHGRHFDYWNQPLNMRMRVCYLYCHESGLCCYLVIHTDNLLRPLQLFHFHLWPIYWFFLLLLTLWGCQ
jgi:hypothetical protein